MPGSLLHVGATVTCTHAAPVTAVTSNSRVLVNGMPVVTISDTFTVAGCPFQIPIPAGTKPQPCVRIQWTVPATRVFVNGQPVLLQVSTGICLSAEQIPQGAPIVSVVQPRVMGT
jgi:hypothetical protein